MAAVPSPLQGLTKRFRVLLRQLFLFGSPRSGDRPELHQRRDRHNGPGQQKPGGSWHSNVSVRVHDASMDPEVRLFVINQLLVIVVPVGVLFALWIGMLSWDRRR